MAVEMSTAPTASQGIEAWESYLRTHFDSLSKRRKAEGPGHPIYALEHGLTPEQVEQFKKSVRHQGALGRPRLAHWLSWVVYASELGYEFSGNEYWGTFEEKTPRWSELGDRYWMRERFYKFRSTYDGATPSGPWAEHFTIICWPITHAILPQDLQRQLARTLFELRMRVSSEVLSSPESFGRMIRQHSWGGSSRFQKFTQDIQLTGQIATALLLHRGAESGSSILPATLDRIAKDLESKRSAREWMRTARATAQERIRPTAAIWRQGGAQEPHAEPPTPGARAALREAGVEPHLLLTPSESSATGHIRHELPDFSDVAARFPETHETLLNSRCRLRGSSGRPMARGRLLRGPQRVRLMDWPGDGVRLLEFDHPCEELEYLLSTECSIRPGPRWLFKVSKDGVARELRTPLVRARNQYVLLQEERLSVPSDPAFKETYVDCSGIRAVAIDLPRSISPTLSLALSTLRLPFAGDTLIWPAGLPPTQWDGEGVIGWLSTDTPCIGLRVDHAVASLSLQAGAETLVVDSPTPGEPLYVELPKLSPGRHTLKVSSTPRGRVLPSEPITLEVIIREPRPWRPSQMSLGPLEINVDPPSPSLEQLLQGEVDLEVNGPRGHQVECMLSLFGEDAPRPLAEQRVFRLPLPISLTSCRERLEDAVKESAVLSSYDLASHAALRFSSGALGEHTLIAEREHTALRWVVGRSRQSFSLRVVDDTGQETTAAAEYYPFKQPDQAERIPQGALETMEDCVGDGGLYVLQAGDHERAIVIPAGVKTLADLKVDAQLRKRTRRPKEILQLIEVIDLWACARVTGDIASRAKRGSVLKATKEELFDLVVGTRERVEEDRRLRTAFQRDARHLTTLTPVQRVRVLVERAGPILGLQNRRGVTSPHGLSSESGELHWLSELALRLSSWPAGVREWAGQDLSEGVSQLLLQPSILRAAARMVEAIDQEQNSRAIGAGAMREGWDWQ